MRSFIEYLNKNKELIHAEPVYFDSERERVRVEVSLQYNDGYAETIFTFANNINTGRAVRTSRASRAASPGASTII